jgi:capsular polysaccharide biosynthesis protein
MNNPAANPSGHDPMPLTVFILVAIGVFFSVSIIATVMTFILPESYDGTARILVTDNSAQSASDFFATTSQVLVSSVVLTPVVEKLDLNEVWGKKYFNGEILKTSETLQILKQRVRIDPVRNTRLISIVAYSDDKLEAPEIANAIAESYRDYRAQSTASKSPPPSPLVEIVDPAVPGRAPVKPNKPVNITLGMGCGAILGLAIGGAVAFIISRFRSQRMHKTAAAT